MACILAARRPRQRHPPRQPARARFGSATPSLRDCDNPRRRQATPRAAPARGGPWLLTAWLLDGRRRSHRLPSAYSQQQPPMTRLRQSVPCATASARGWSRTGGFRIGTCRRDLLHLRRRCERLLHPCGCRCRCRRAALASSDTGALRRLLALGVPQQIPPSKRPWPLRRHVEPGGSRAREWHPQRGHA